MNIREFLFTTFDKERRENMDLEKGKKYFLNVLAIIFILIENMEKSIINVKCQKNLSNNGKKKLKRIF